MDATQIFKCLADEQRLRILNLLYEGPLCVCHIQEILEESQVKTSKQLLYMGKLSLVSASRMGTWKVYRIHEDAPDLLFSLLDLLRHQQSTPATCQHDLIKRDDVIKRISHECGTPDSIIKTVSCACNLA